MPREKSYNTLCLKISRQHQANRSGQRELATGSCQTAVKRVERVPKQAGLMLSSSNTPKAGISSQEAFDNDPALFLPLTLSGNAHLDSSPCLSLLLKLVLSSQNSIIPACLSEAAKQVLPSHSPNHPWTRRLSAEVEKGISRCTKASGTVITVHAQELVVVLTLGTSSL